MSEHREGTLSTADLVSNAEKPRADQEAGPMPQPQPRPAANPPSDGRPMNARPTEAERPAVAAKAEPLFPANEGEQFRSRWTSIQTSFVDEPRKAVEQADGLVAEM